MTFQYYPNKEIVDGAMAKEEPLIMLIGFDAENAIIAPLDEAVEHNILLNKCNLNPLDIDKYFRIIFDTEGADWTFVCPPDYKNITEKSKRITRFYNDGFNVISNALIHAGYLVSINIPKRYRRHIEELRGE